jgi:uncharacterized protein (DUF1501 family)
MRTPHPDIETADALSLLSVPDLSALTSAGMERRRFLQLLGAGAGVGAASLALSPGARAAHGLSPDSGTRFELAPPVGAAGEVLVLVTLYGGTDGLNMIVPHTDPIYRAARPDLRIDTDDVLPIDSNIGFHPALTGLKQRFDAGEVAIVEGVGYPNPDLSHFFSMGIWMNGWVPTGNPGNGWIGRWLDSLGSAYSPLTAITIGSSVPLHLAGGSRRAIAVPPWGINFGGSADATDRRLYDALRSFAGTGHNRGGWYDAIAATITTQLDVADQISPVFTAPLPENDTSRDFELAARLINANLGTRVIDIGLGGLDTHANQEGDLTRILTDLDAGITRLYASLEPAWRPRITIAVISEFGRTLFENESHGTDHGTANPVLVIGSRVKGGLHGERPSLEGLPNYWDRIEATCDFRSVYANLVSHVFAADPAQILGGRISSFDLLEPIDTTVPPDPPPPVVVTSGVVIPVNDTVLRSSSTLGTTTVDVTVAGKAGLPATPTLRSVLIELQAQGATANGLVRAWPAGTTAPTTGVPMTTGTATSSLFWVAVPASGRISIAVSAGTAKVAVVVKAYSRASSGAPTTALSPTVLTAAKTLLDTTRRTRARGPARPLAAGSTTTINCASTVGGTGTSARWVWASLNVTARNKAARVTISSADKKAFQITVPARTEQTRLIRVKLNSTRKITVATTAAADIRVDVVAVDSPATNTTGRVTFAPTPARWFKTGVGSAPAQLNSTPATVTIAGKAGVPATGVKAVLAHMTVLPTAATVQAWSSATAPAKSGYVASRSAANSGLVWLPVTTSGTVKLRAVDGTARVTLDVVGWVT